MRMCVYVFFLCVAIAYNVHRNYSCELLSYWRQMRDNNTGFKRKKKSLFFRNQYILTGFMNFVICNFVTKHSMETRFIQIINLRVHHNSSLTVTHTKA